MNVTLVSTSLAHGALAHAQDPRSPRDTNEGNRSMNVCASFDQWRGGNELHQDRIKFSRSEKSVSFDRFHAFYRQSLTEHYSSRSPWTWTGGYQIDDIGSQSTVQVNLSTGMQGQPESSGPHHSSLIIKGNDSCSKRSLSSMAACLDYGHALTHSSHSSAW